MTMRRPALIKIALIIACLGSGGLAGCRRKEPAAPPVATPSVTLSHARVPLGAPVEITYRFAVAPVP